MGLAFSLVVIAVGAILAFAVTDDVSGIDIEVVGWILMAVGGVGFLLTLAFWSSWWGPGYWRRERYVEGDPYDRRRRLDDASGSWRKRTRRRQPRRRSSR